VVAGFASGSSEWFLHARLSEAAAAVHERVEPAQIKAKESEIKKKEREEASSISAGGVAQPERPFQGKFSDTRRPPNSDQSHFQTFDAEGRAHRCRDLPALNFRLTFWANRPTFGV